MVMDYAGCSSDKDLVTFVDWSEEAPNVFINFRDDPTKPGRMNCYNGDSLKYWLNQPENTFAKWVDRKANKPMDAMGYGGMPDLTHKYVKMYTGEYIEYSGLVVKLQKGAKYPVILDADYTATERLGNLGGVFGIGDVHGQSPGYRVYKLRTDKPVELEIAEEESEDEEDEEDEEESREITPEVPRRIVPRRIVEEEEDEEENEEDLDPIQIEAINMENLLAYVTDAPLVRESFREREFGFGLNEYLAAETPPSDREKLSLPNRIAFEISTQFPEGEITPVTIAKIVDKARRYLKILYEKMGDDVGEEGTPTFLESQDFVDQITMRMYMWDMFRLIRDGDLNQIQLERFREVEEKYGLRARYFLVEALARWGLDESSLTAEWLGSSITGLSSRVDTNLILLVRRKAFASIVARAMIAANYEVVRFIEEYTDGVFGLPRDSHLYINLLEQPVRKPDTFTNMIDFYYKLGFLNEVTEIKDLI